MQIILLHNSFSTLLLDTVFIFLLWNAIHVQYCTCIWIFFWSFVIEFPTILTCLSQHAKKIETKCYFNIKNFLSNTNFVIKMFYLLCCMEKNSIISRWSNLRSLTETTNKLKGLYSIVSFRAVTYVLGDFWVVKNTRTDIFVLSKKFFTGCILWNMFVT